MLAQPRCFSDSAALIASFEGLLCLIFDCWVFALSDELLAAIVAIAFGLVRDCN